MGQRGTEGTHTSVVGRGSFLPFDEALAVARSLRLPSREAWRSWSSGGKRPANIPSNPNTTYAPGGTGGGGWAGWPRWLGTDGGTPSDGDSNGDNGDVNDVNDVNDDDDDKESGDDDDPGTRSRVGVGDTGDNGGTGDTGEGAREFLAFAKALALVRSARLVNQTEWRAWCKDGQRPLNIPSRPDRTYVHSVAGHCPLLLVTASRRVTLRHAASRCVTLRHTALALRHTALYCSFRP